MKKTPLLLLIFMLGLGVTLMATAQPAPAGDLRQATDSRLLVVRAYFSDPQMVADLSTWTEPWEVNYERGYVVLGVTRSEYDHLVIAGFDVELDAELTAQFSRPNVPLPGQGEDTIPGYPCYRTVEGTFNTAASLAAAYPNLATWMDVGDSWEKVTPGGNAGYDMMVLKLTNNAIPGPKPVMFITSAIHAREYTTAELMTRFAEYLVYNYNVDPDVTWVLDNHEVHLMLHTNPDGRKYAETGLSWRKNTNNNYCANTNSRGADLNRNFEFLWGCCGGSSGSECSETYRGASPASEPEVQAVQNHARNVFPDQREDPIDQPAPPDATGLYIDIHSYSELVLWPWGFTATPTGNGTALQTLGRKFAYFNDYFPEQAIGLYPTDGTTDDFIYGDLGVAAYTFELGTSFFQSCSTFENQILPDNMEALKYGMKVPRTPYLTPAGPEALNVAVSNGMINPGDPVVLTGVVNDARFSNNNGVEPTQNIAAAEYYIDTPPWDGGTPIAMQPSDGSFNSPAEGVTANLNTNSLPGGRHLLYVRGRDTANNWGPVSAVFLYVLGGNEGSVDGYLTDSLTGEPLSGMVYEPNLGISTNSNPATGFYSLSLPQGSWTIQASANYHEDATIPNVTVTDGNVTPLDIELDPTPGLGLPPSVFAQLPLGQTTQEVLRIDNLGNLPLTWQLKEIDGGYEPPAATALSVLLVDDDDNSPNVRPLYEAALTTLGISYSVFDVGGGSGNGPTAAAMSAYDIVIWFSGDQFGTPAEAGPNATDEAELTTYLNGGGRLFLSSQDYYYDRGLTSFMQNYLGVGSISNDNGNYTSVTGQNNFAGLGPYSLSYPGTDYSDPVTPNANAQVGFLGNNGNNAGIYNDNTVFFPFMWEGIQNANAGNGVQSMEAILDQLVPPEIVWLSANVTSGTIPGGSYTDVILTFSSQPPISQNGLYTGTVRIQSNDPAHPFGDVPVSMNVTDTPTAYTLNYQYAMNNGQNGSGTYYLYQGGSFSDSAGGGGVWVEQANPHRLYMLHQNSQCNALSIGAFPGGNVINGYRICRDGSGALGAWTSTIVASQLPE